MSRAVVPVPGVDPESAVSTSSRCCIGGDSTGGSLRIVKALGGGSEPRTLAVILGNLAGLIVRSGSGALVTARGSGGRSLEKSCSNGISSGVAFLVATGVDGIVTFGSDSLCLRASPPICLAAPAGSGERTILDSIDGVDFKRSVASRTDDGTRLSRMAPDEEVGLSLAADLEVPLDSSLELPQGDGKGFRGDMVEIACGTMGAAKLLDNPLLLLMERRRPSDPECEYSENRRDLTGLRRRSDQYDNRNNMGHTHLSPARLAVALRLARSLRGLALEEDMDDDDPTEAPIELELAASPGQTSFPFPLSDILLRSGMVVLKPSTLLAPDGRPAEEPMLSLRSRKATPILVLIINGSIEEPKLSARGRGYA